MRNQTLYLLLIFLALGVIPTVAGGQSAYASFRSHNQGMAAYQPALITPVVTPDPRIIQYARFSVAHQYTPAKTETINFGNCRGIGLVVGRRFEFDWTPPTYIVHNSAAKDGSGDTTLLAKYRIASGNAENGNFDLAAVLTRTFATGSHLNGAATASYTPTITGAWAHRRFDVIGAVGGQLPTGKVAQQGRTVLWNTAAQAHMSRSLWLELEDNATYFHGGPRDGRTQNFITPAVLAVVRRKAWKPMHPYFIVDAGMQVATTHFHTYNHNLITEVRMIF